MDYLKSRSNCRARQTCCLTDFIFNPSIKRSDTESVFVLGVLEGEGVGPEIIRTTLNVLSAVESISHSKFDVRFGGPIGLPSESHFGKVLCDNVIDFCRDIFSEGGVVLSGPGGGRFVYDLRKQFDLFCKLVPLTVFNELSEANRIKQKYTHSVDIILIRENLSGIYQGYWQEVLLNEGRRAEHSFFYTEKEVCRILQVAAKIAQCRRGELTVILKDNGIPSVSKLWRDCTIEVASETAIKYSFVNIDLAVYQLIQHAQELDTIVAPNLFGDVLADVGGVLIGSRGLTYSGNFSSNRAAVYQTNHGAAYDMKDTNNANPIGQIFSLAMLLRESFGLLREARLIEDAVADVWRQGWRTNDLAESGCRITGTKEIGEIIAKTVIKLSNLSYVK